MIKKIEVTKDFVNVFGQRKGNVNHKKISEQVRVDCVVRLWLGEA